MDMVEGLLLAAQTDGLIIPTSLRYKARLPVWLWMNGL